MKIVLLSTILALSCAVETDKIAPSGQSSDALSYENETPCVVSSQSETATVLECGGQLYSIPHGKDGADGKDGIDGQDGAKGDKGDQGADGRDGADGREIGATRAQGR